MRLYFAFIDFKNLFDFVDRRLSKVAIEGKSFEVALYRHVKFCIGVEGFLSEYFLIT